jgi:UDP-glucose 4-epimerase
MLSGMPPTAAGAGATMGGAFFLPRANLQDLLDILREDGRRLIGPTIADETIVYEEISTGLPYTILRPSSPVGIGERQILRLPGEEGRGKLATNHVIPDLAIKILSGQDPVHIFGEGNQIRSFIAVRDLALGIRLAIESPDAVNADFNLCRGKGITILALAEKIWQKLRPHDEFHYVSDTPYPYDVPNRVPDVRKAKAILGFEATTPLDAMLDEVIGWVRDEMAAGVLTSETRA